MNDDYTKQLADTLAPLVSAHGYFAIVNALSLDAARRHLRAIEDKDERQAGKFSRARTAFVLLLAKLI